MPEAGPEIPRVEEITGEEIEHHGFYGRVIAVAVVGTTLIGALVAFAQAAALFAHDKADYRAERYGALALSAGAIDRGKAQVQIDRFNLLSQQIQQADNASLFQQYGSATKAAALTAARWNAVAKQTETDTVAIARSQGTPYICSPTFQKNCPASDAAYSPEQDPSFPQRFQQQAQYSSYQLSALRDAANQQAEDAESKFVHYAAALTMLAVAVFLLGYSLTPQGQARRTLYSRVAAVFVLVAGIWSLIEVLPPITKPSDQAAADYANGQIAASEGDYQAAIAQFDRAISLRPRFVDAYIQRAASEYNAGIPRVGSGATAQQSTAGPVTIPTAAALDQAVADLEHAHDEGSAAPTLLATLANDLLYRGLIRRQDADVRLSRQFAEQALDGFREEEQAADLVANTQFVLAEDDLVLGNPTASDEYRAAEAQLKSNGVNSEAVVAAALTDLSLIDTQHPALVNRTQQLRAEIAARGGDVYGVTPNAYSGQGYGNHVVRFARIKAEPDPGHALYLIGDPGSFDPNHDRLSVQWEYQDPVHGEWAGLPEISGPVTKGELTSFSDGTYASDNPSYVSSTEPATCLPPGRYRVELFVNQRLAGEATAVGQWPELKAVRFRQVSGAVCVPPGWQPFPDTGPGVDAYSSSDLTSGAFILSIPKAAAASYQNNSQALAGLMEATVQGFAGKDSPLAGLQSQGAAHSTPFFMSSSNGQQEFWTYGQGDVYSGVGTSANGQVYVGLTWGHTNEQAFQLFLSLSPL